MSTTTSPTLAGRLEHLRRTRRAAPRPAVGAGQPGQHPQPVADLRGRAPRAGPRRAGRRWPAGPRPAARTPRRARRGAGPPRRRTGRRRRSSAVRRPAAAISAASPIATVVRPGAPVGPQTATSRPGPCGVDPSAGAATVAASGDRARPTSAPPSPEHAARRAGCRDRCCCQHVLDPEPPQPLRSSPSSSSVRRGDQDHARRPARRSTRRCRRRGPGSAGDTTATEPGPAPAVASRSVRSTQPLDQHEPAGRARAARAPAASHEAARPRRRAPGPGARRRRPLIAGGERSTSPRARAAIDVGSRASWSAPTPDDDLAGRGGAERRAGAAGADTHRHVVEDERRAPAARRVRRTRPAGSPRRRPTSRPRTVAGTASAVTDSGTSVNAPAPAPPSAARGQQLAGPDGRRQRGVRRAARARRTGSGRRPRLVGEPRPRAARGRRDRRAGRPAESAARPHTGTVSSAPARSRAPEQRATRDHGQRRRPAAGRATGSGRPWAGGRRTAGRGSPRFARSSARDRPGCHVHIMPSLIPFDTSLVHRLLHRPNATAKREPPKQRQTLA